MACTTHALMFGHSDQPLSSFITQIGDTTLYDATVFRGFGHSIASVYGGLQAHRASNCRNCGASQAKDGRCAYCGSDQ